MWLLACVALVLLLQYLKMCRDCFEEWSSNIRKIEKEPSSLLWMEGVVHTTMPQDLFRLMHEHVNVRMAQACECTLLAFVMAP